MTKKKGGQTGKRISLRGCINLKCKDCVYDPLDTGTWRQQVQACTVQLCPLWKVRPCTTGSSEE